jgi:hypothetical protein
MKRMMRTRRKMRRRRRMGRRRIRIDEEEGGLMKERLMMRLNVQSRILMQIFVLSSDLNSYLKGVLRDDTSLHSLHPALVNVSMIPYSEESCTDITNVHYLEARYSFEIWCL